MRALITDSCFPNKYALWRLCLFDSFFKEYDCDVLVIDKIDKFSGVSLNFDWDELKDQFDLNQYDIVIFNPKYNYLNKYNDDFDGTQYNNHNVSYIFENKKVDYKISCSYMLRKKKYRQEKIDFVKNYNFVFHIFYMNYQIFNRFFYYPKNRQFTWFCPGGGLRSFDQVCNFEDSNVICTQKALYDTAVVSKEGAKKLIFGGQFFYKNERPKRKTFSKNKFKIVISNLGDPISKGVQDFLNISECFFKKHPDLKEQVEFIVIGNAGKKTPDVTIKAPMSQRKLSEFYYEEVDVIFNLSKGTDGWPLGIEGAKEGCILLSLDPHGFNKKNNYKIDDFHIVDLNIDNICKKIYNIYKNKELKINRSFYIQDKIFDLFSYNKHTKNIFYFIKSIIKN